MQPETFLGVESLRELVYAMASCSQFEQLYIYIDMYTFPNLATIARMMIYPEVPVCIHGSLGRLGKVWLCWPCRVLFALQDKAHGRARLSCQMASVTVGWDLPECMRGFLGQRAKAGLPKQVPTPHVGTFQRDTERKTRAVRGELPPRPTTH